MSRVQSGDVRRILIFMLTRIYIDNFLSFVNFEYKPTQKQLLLGANGSGKSSLLEAIRFIKQFINDDLNPFTQSTRTRWQDQPLQVFEIDAVLDNKEFRYRVEIQFAPTTRQPSVHLESLKVDGTTVFELANGEVHFFLNDGKEATPVPFGTTLSALKHAQLSNSRVRRFIEWIESVHCFKIDPYTAKMDERADSEEKYPDYEVENLAGWYLYLLGAYPDDNARFISSLRSSLNGFNALRFSSEEDGMRKLRADFMAPTKKKGSYALEELSDGQRTLIALYMILHFSISKGNTVFIDEPDNYVSLNEIQPWLMAATQEVEDHNGQLILISHHPELLNQWATEYGLRFFREENGHVRTEKFKGDPDGTLQPSELIARGWELA